ncbi:MAG: NAD-dependent succinate-semialdehyde dehydrogenase [Gammaproteobacteria bacterium]|nr:NAD-dependent succinate-semialdehyde dehydrogenase [Gammaproteobacteria bacterium]
MSLLSINPVNGKVVNTFKVWDQAQLQCVLHDVMTATPCWAARSINERSQSLIGVAEKLKARREELAQLASLEMGKLIGEARTEIDKCAAVCEYYAKYSSQFLKSEEVTSDASKSYVTYQPLGTVLAIMPWNFPFWQLFRCAVPALISGNTVLLKHASNVPQCAHAIEQIFKAAGMPKNIFRTLDIEAKQVADVISHDSVQMVALTGSEYAGRKVAAIAGAHLKKTVLELGGTDAFIVLEDAQIDLAVETALISRFLNAGQSCIAAKRFIVVDAVADLFVDCFKQAIETLQMGSPLDEAVTLAPMARLDLRDELHQQVMDSVALGATPVTGCVVPELEGSFYPASLLDYVRSGMPAYEDELFGPVAAVIRVSDEKEALAVANSSRYGLGGSVWTADQKRGEALALQMQSGACFVNGLVKSDPRLPFGGVKASGYGRELFRHGIREFVSAKTIWLR